MRLDGPNPAAVERERKVGRRVVSSARRGWGSAMPNTQICRREDSYSQQPGPTHCETSQQMVDINEKRGDRSFFCREVKSRRWIEYEGSMDLDKMGTGKARRVTGASQFPEKMIQWTYRSSTGIRAPRSIYMNFAWTGGVDGGA
jgi:hypothetical protein